MAEMGFRAEIAHNCSISVAMYLQSSQKHRGKTTELLHWKKQRQPENVWVFQIHIYIRFSCVFSFQPKFEFVKWPKETFAIKKIKWIKTSGTQENFYNDCYHT